MRKWEYIAKALKHMNAPEDVVHAAQRIDNELIKLGLDYNTEAWEEYRVKHLIKDETIISLSSIINNPRMCSACTTKDGEDVPCDVCLLRDYQNGGQEECTPKEVYGTNLFRKVCEYVAGQLRYGI